MHKVSFKEMKEGTKEDYLLLDKHEKKFIKNTGERILNFAGLPIGEHKKTRKSPSKSKQSSRKKKSPGTRKSKGKTSKSPGKK